MFPKELDGAKVLFYSQRDEYGAIKYPNGEIADCYRYLAICQYANATQCYLFCCNEEYEVVCDSVWSDVETCMKVAAASYECNAIWHKVLY